jgi:hypothetical protein
MKSYIFYWGSRPTLVTAKMTKSSLEMRPPESLTQGLVQNPVGPDSTATSRPAKHASEIGSNPSEGRGYVSESGRQSEVIATRVAGEGDDDSGLTSSKTDSFCIEAVVVTFIYFFDLFAQG